jgi:AraC family transcriptional regulator, exoenzyme S synthesis regulatory protein ExsA
MLNLYDYISDSRMFKTFKIDDLLFVEYKCLIEETRTGYWTHNNYFIYVVGGKKKWKTRDKEFLLENGEALFIKKGAYTAHQYFDEDFCALGIFIPDEFIKSVLNKFLEEKRITPAKILKSDPIIPVQLDESLSAYFLSVLSYFSKTSTPPKNLLAIKFEELILNILASPLNNEIANIFWEIHGSSKVSIRDIMETYFTYNMCLEEYARLCSRSLSAFKTDFYSLYNTSPGKWLIKKRLDYGKFLLETTDKSISEIAFETGFKNQSHFTRCFKEAYHKSPIKFRSSYQVLVNN